jgi:pimeloyl-ACP methyl ester carboxylesterase
LATAVKSGNYTGSIGTPKSLVLVGHSFGSAITNAVVRTSPTLADGLILTGWSFLRSAYAKTVPKGFNFNVDVSRGSGVLETFQPRIASGEDSKWKALDNVIIFYNL